jgi:hypothetical protein
MNAPDESQATDETADTPFTEHRVESVKPKPAAGSLDGVKKVSVPTPAKVREIGGPPGPEPTRYGDWQFNGKVTDF